MNQIGLLEAYDDEDEQIEVSVSGAVEGNEVIAEEEHELECDSMIAEDINDEEAIQAIEMIDVEMEEQPLDDIPNQQLWSGFKLVGSTEIFAEDFSVLYTKHVRSTTSIVMPFLTESTTVHCQILREKRSE